MSAVFDGNTSSHARSALPLIPPCRIFREILIDLKRLIAIIEQFLKKYHENDVSH
jgi:hypothetical protein